MMLESEKESYEAFNMRIRGEEAIREVIELKAEVERLKDEKTQLANEILRLERIIYHQ